MRPDRDRHLAKGVKGSTSYYKMSLSKEHGCQEEKEGSWLQFQKEGRKGWGEKDLTASKKRMHPGQDAILQGWVEDCEMTSVATPQKWPGVQRSSEGWGQNHGSVFERPCPCNCVECRSMPSGIKPFYTDTHYEVSNRILEDKVLASMEQSKEGDWVFRGEKLLLTRRIKNPKGGIPCPICIKTFTTTCALYQHMRAKANAARVGIGAFSDQHIVKAGTITSPSYLPHGEADVNMLWHGRVWKTMQCSFCPCMIAACAFSFENWEEKKRKRNYDIKAGKALWMENQPDWIKEILQRENLSLASNTGTTPITGTTQCGSHGARPVQ